MFRIISRKPVSGQTPEDKGFKLNSFLTRKNFCIISQLFCKYFMSEKLKIINSFSLKSIYILNDLKGWKLIVFLNCIPNSYDLLFCRYLTDQHKVNYILTNNILIIFYFYKSEIRKLVNMATKQVLLVTRHTTEK